MNRVRHSSYSDPKTNTLDLSIDDEFLGLSNNIIHTIVLEHFGLPERCRALRTDGFEK